MLVCSVVATPGEPAVMLVSPAPVANMEGLDASLQVLRAKPSAEFNVVVVQRNGEMQDRREARLPRFCPPFSPPPPTHPPPPTSLPRAAAPRVTDIPRPRSALR